MQRTWNWTIKPQRIELAVSIADELWYNELANGERKTQLLGIAFYKRKDEPQSVVYSLTILWFVLRIGYRSK